MQQARMPRRGKIRHANPSGDFRCPFELGGLDRGADLGPVERLVETLVAGHLALFGKGVVEEAEVTLGRAFAQDGQLKTVKRIKNAAALAQGALPRLQSAYALQGKESRDAVDA
jgi:hypothetical protein